MSKRVLALSTILLLSCAGMLVGGTGDFELGLWYVGHEIPYPGYISGNEQALLLELGANWLLDDSEEADYMAFCNSTGGACKLAIYTDPLGGPNLWWNFASSADEYPDSTWVAGVDTFLTRVYDTYGQDDGFWGYAIDEEGAQNDVDNYYGLQYICSRIDQIDPYDHYSYLCQLPSHSEFFDRVDSLDVMEVYQYPFGINMPYSGTQFQQMLEWLVNYYGTGAADFEGKHTRWRAIIQSFRKGIWQNDEWVWTMRWPTPSELSCQAYLALSRGATGIVAFTYHSQPVGWAEGLEGLVTYGSPREKTWVDVAGMPGGGFYPFDAMKDLFADLKALGPEVNDYQFDTGFTNDEIPAGGLVSAVSGNYIEIGTFQDSLSDDEAIMLVNRVCSDSVGAPADSQTVSVTFTPSWGGSAVKAVITDMATGIGRVASYVSGGYSYEIGIPPGGGKFLRIREINATVIEVPDDYSSIQDAILHASTGDLVLVSPGTYYENLNLLGKAITVASYFIYDGDFETIESTIINGSAPTDTTQGSVVSFVAGEDTNTVLTGFTITGGSGTLWTQNIPTLRQGGGIYCKSASPKVTHNIITNNHITGPGVGGSREMGGGIALWDDCHPVIANNLITNNSALDNGNGINFYYVAHEDTLIIAENTIVDNEGGNGGGGIVMDINFGFHKIVNNIVANNDGDGIRISRDGDYEVSGNDCWGNEDSDYDMSGWSTSIGDTSLSTNRNGFASDPYGNIIEDPDFINSGTDYRLEVGSPCVNAGTDASYLAAGEDLWGGARLRAGHLDIGAYEYQADPAHVVCLSHDIDDSGGNDNGVANYNETVLLSPTVVNAGGTFAYGLSVILRCTDSLVTISDSVESISSIAPDSTFYCEDAFSFRVAPAAADSHVIFFDLEISGDSTWTSHFNHTIIRNRFLLQPSPGEVLVHAGTDAVYDINVVPLGGFKWDVDLSYDSLPTGLTADFDPETVSPPDESEFRVASDSTMDSLTHTITLSGDGYSLTEEATVSIRVLFDGLNCSGNANGLEEVDIDDVVYLSNFIFSNGPVPRPYYCCGDVTGDCSVDIDDLIYLIDYIFTGGPAPVNSCEICVP